MEVKRSVFGTLKVEVHPTAKAAGEAAARAAAATMQQLARAADVIPIVFATGASQLKMLEALTAMPDLPWNKVRGFHLDDYVGVPADHPASFRHYLRKNLVEKVPIKEFLEIDSTAPDVNRVCREYAEKLRAANPQLCLLGIGENGHLAFNDPAEANFNDPLDVKVVELDEACRQQQAAEGWFRTMDDVPKAALTVTMPALFRIPKMIASVPGSRKARIMRRVLEAPISTDVPATILRTHPDTTVYLDLESAAELDGLL
jgi:glucosamine-6-phosphate deaminase